MKYKRTKEEIVEALYDTMVLKPLNESEIIKKLLKELLLAFKYNEYFVKKL